MEGERSTGIICQYWLWGDILDLPFVRERFLSAKCKKKFLHQSICFPFQSIVYGIKFMFNSFRTLYPLKFSSVKKPSSYKLK